MINTTEKSLEGLMKTLAKQGPLTNDFENKVTAEILLNGSPDDGSLSTEAKKFLAGLDEQEIEVIKLLYGNRPMDEDEIVAITGIDRDKLQRFIQRAAELHLIGSIDSICESTLAQAANLS